MIGICSLWPHTSDTLTKAIGTKNIIALITAAYFEKVEEKFNATHKNIRLKIESPNDASTIMRTRFIREDYPDIIGIGGDINYSYFLDAEILMNISDYKGLDEIKESYKEIDKNLEFVPTDGVYAVPYAGNAAGILYNKKIFEEHGWKIPHWFMNLRLIRLS